MRMVPVGARRVVRGQRISMSYDLPGTIERMTLSAMPLGLQCAPWKWKFVLLNWCGCEVAGQDIAVGRQVVDKPNLQGLARLHAQRRTQPAFVSAQVEACAADVAIGVGAAQAGAEHTVRRGRTSGSTSGWSIAGTTGNFVTPSSGMWACAPPDCPSAARWPSASVPIAKPACSKPRRETCGPSPRLVPKNSADTFASP